MAKFKKAILQAGRKYHSPDGVVDVTPERLKHWQGEFAKLTANGYIVPIDWDHASDLKGAAPRKLSTAKTRSAKNTVGKLAAFNVAPDGNSAEVLLDITDPQAKGRAERNEVYVSPVIFDRWADGAKNQYTDLITHVDIVNHPVDNSQGPFVPVEPGTIACGLRMSLSGKGISRMAFPDDEEDTDSDPDADTDPIEEGEENAAPEAQPMGDKNPDAPPAATDNSKTEAVLAGLKQKNIVLPSDFDFTADGAIDIFLAAINSALAAELTAKPAEPEEDEPEEEDDIMQVQDPGYAAMSLQAKAAHSYAEKQYRGGIQTRLSALLNSGRCEPAEFKARETEVTAVKLSLGSDGEPAKSDLEKWIESREAVPAGTFWSDQVKTQRMSLEVQQPPSGSVADPQEDERIVNWALGRKTK